MTTSNDAISIHTICECDNARHMNPVSNKYKTSFSLEVDALIIWLSKYLLLLSIIRTITLSIIRESNCGNQPILKFAWDTDSGNQPTISIQISQNDQVPEEQKTTAF